MTSTKAKISSHIVFACFMLCNFRTNIVSKHAWIVLSYYYKITQSLEPTTQCLKLGRAREPRLKLFCSDSDFSQSLLYKIPFWRPTGSNILKPNFYDWLHCVLGFSLNEFEMFPDIFVTIHKIQKLNCCKTTQNYLKHHIIQSKPTLWFMWPFVLVFSRFSV